MASREWNCVREQRIALLCLAKNADRDAERADMACNDDREFGKQPGRLSR
ncbi:hypothetical protein BRDID11002_23760 [Bradyrhizobium diazoefficiens]